MRVALQASSPTPPASRAPAGGAASRGAAFPRRCSASSTRASESRRRPPRDHGPNPGSPRLTPAHPGSPRLEVAINYHRKNGVGHFYSPLHTFIDTRFLDTVSRPDIRSGCGEIMKVPLARLPPLPRGGAPASHALSRAGGHHPRRAPLRATRRPRRGDDRSKLPRLARGAAVWLSDHFSARVGSLLGPFLQAERVIQYSIDASLGGGVVGRARASGRRVAL